MGCYAKAFFLIKKKFFLAKSLGILVPQPGMGSVPPAVETQSCNDTPVEEVPAAAFFNVRCGSCPSISLSLVLY